MRFLLILTFLILFSSVRAQTVEGVVLDQRGAAIAGAKIKVEAEGKMVASTVTNGDGKFAVRSNGERETRIEVTAKGFRPFTKSLAGIDENLEITLVAGIDQFELFTIGPDDSRIPESPASVLGISRETLQTTAALRIDDALRQVPGFTLFRRGSSRTSNPTTQGANLRGLAGSGASRANVLLDGFSLNDAFGGWTNWSRVPSVAVEQAEVLRGGASAFYGDQGLSGAVVMRSVRAVKPIVRVELSAGSQRTFDGGLFAAYVRGDWAADVAFEQFQTAGYVPTVASERGTADTRAGSRFRNTVVRLERRFGEKYVFARGGIFGERRDNGTSLTNNGTYFRQFAAGAEAFGIRVRAFIEKQVYDQTFTAISNNRNTETLSRIQRVPSQAFGGSVAWSRGVGKAHSLSASAEFRDVKGFSDESVYASGRVTTIVGAGGAQRTFGVFAQDVWQVTRRLNVSIGGRVDRWTNYGALSASTVVATRRTTTSGFPDRIQNAFSPRVAALLAASDRVSLVASFARSFRAPTLNELYRAFRVGNVLTLANENLRSETANTFDAGIRVKEFGGKVTIRATGFHTRVANPVVSATLSTTASLVTRQRQNVGTARATGVEIDAEFRPLPVVSFSAGYLFTDSRFPTSGFLVPQVSRHQFTFQGLFRPLSKMTFSMQGRASGAQFEDDLNTLTLRRYFTLDAFASYKLERVEIFAAIENATNSRYDIGRTPNLTVASPRFGRIGIRF